MVELYFLLHLRETRTFLCARSPYGTRAWAIAIEGSKCETTASESYIRHVLLTRSQDVYVSCALRW